MNTIQYNTKGSRKPLNCEETQEVGKGEKRILVTVGLGIWSNDALASFSKSKYVGRSPL